MNLTEVWGYIPEDRLTDFDNWLAELNGYHYDRGWLDGYDFRDQHGK